MTVENDEKRESHGLVEAGSDSRIGADGRAQEFATAVRDGIALDIGDSTVNLRFVSSAGSEGCPALARVDAHPAVWLDSAREADGRLRVVVVSGVPNVDGDDLRLATEELRMTLAQEPELVRRLRKTTLPPCPEQLIFVDAIWEANAPLSKVLSPHAQILGNIGGEVVTSGFSARVWRIFERAFRREANKRLGVDAPGQAEFLSHVRLEILSACDEFLSDGRSARLTSVSDKQHTYDAATLPDVLVAATYAQYHGRKVLLAWDPTETEQRLSVQSSLLP